MRDPAVHKSMVRVLLTRALILWRTPCLVCGPVLFLHSKFTRGGFVSQAHHFTLIILHIRPGGGWAKIIIIACAAVAVAQDIGTPYTLCMCVGG